MPIKKSNDIGNEGSNFANQKNTSKLENITARFDDTTHNDNPYDDAIQYLVKKVDQIVDETNVQTVASGSYNTEIKTLTTASGSFSTRVTLNDAKVTNADQSKSDIDGLGITTVGTIDTGVWQGTTIKTAYIGDDQITEDKLANTLLAEIDANTAKVGTETDLSTTAGMAVLMTVNENRGVYSLTFTMTHGRITKTATVNLA
tara:strand:+ start:1576 stop:2181 length:606 start_codon:yes stop_codon:yes gene_type:complete